MCIEAWFFGIGMGTVGFILGMCYAIIIVERDDN